MNVVRQENVKIRKAHNCWGCRMEFLPPTVMEAVTSVDGNTMTTVYWCEPCQKAMDKLPRYYRPADDEGWDYGGLQELLKEIK